jgi:5'-nucleotidase
MNGSPPRVLIANDDGIGAPGLRALADAARRMSDDVWTVAPERKWTAASHQLSFDREQTLSRIGDRVYACSGAPADCVVAAMTIVFDGTRRPDVVLAGVNDKPNVGEDIAYSGTAAIAREASFWGVPAISVSRSGHAGFVEADVDALGELLQTLWRARADWALDGCWLGVNLPAKLPAPIVQGRMARDKIAGAVDIVAATDDRVTFRLRRGRPGTAVAGDENWALGAGAITVSRFCWHVQLALPDAVIAGWQAGDKMSD